MRKKGLTKLLLTLILVFMCSAAFFTRAKAFSDVDPSAKSAQAITELSSLGIISGYPDGTFRPNNKITRVELAAVMSKAFKYEDASAMYSYVDVPMTSWFYDYVMRVSNAGIMNGTGMNRFNPNADITHNELMKMSVSQLGKDKFAQELGAWPKGYAEVAKIVGIADQNVYGAAKASRAEVCEYISKIFKYQNNKDLVLDGKAFTVGMDASALDAPGEVLASAYEGTDWYFYNIDDYENFYALLVKNDIVLGFAAVGHGFNYMGKSAGDSSDAESNVYLTDQFDSNRIYAIYLKPSLSSIRKQDIDYRSMGKANYHFTNAFRVYHNESPLTWNDSLETAARLHSEDMATRNYFSHQSPDGERFTDRYARQGLERAGGENIAMGTSLDELDVLDLWVNSEGHRSNILESDYRYLGVGAYRSGGSAKASFFGASIYYTQNFAFNVR